MNQKPPRPAPYVVFVLLALMACFVVALPAAATSVTVGTVSFDIAMVDAGRTFDRLVLATFQDKTEIAGQGPNGQLYRLTPSFTQVIVEPAKGQVMTPDSHANLRFGGVVQGVTGSRKKSEGWWVWGPRPVTSASSSSRLCLPSTASVAMGAE